MVILDHVLAQEIVDRTMSIIGHNVNVMNSAGIIIGSGEANRIGQVHDGAVLAISHGESLELTEQQCSTLQGVKPGINMLLKLHGEVVGTVGVTGEPDTIRDFASLVKMTAELTIEQAALVEKFQWDRRHREEFILSWIKGSLTDEELKDWAMRLSIDITQPRVATVIEVSTSSASKSMKSVRNIVELLEYPERNNLVAIVSVNEIVVLKPCKSIQQWNSQVESERIDKLISRLSDHDSHTFHIALGQVFSEPKDVALSYQSAKQVLAVGKQFYPEQRKYLFDDLRLPVLLAPLADIWQGEQIIDSVNLLNGKDKSGQLLKTLDVLFECDGNVKECANAMFIHRNTLRYRLDKITEITGLSTTDFVGLAELYIATRLSKII
ncbi:helix-turn-helix domain-containing protein [Vibrio natriegens]|uniref:sugar diacid recognition domain-containing protein n=1 Tax=Vibrio natriegens TaxID=691 RepID=UPI0021E8D7B4|nr:sugar diacid recognition domain-containing protein [Vibrio natriegens]UYI48841.1 helix-turn-helix domain-containing protein [Vibrio natriegens]